MPANALAARAGQLAAAVPPGQSAAPLPCRRARFQG